MLMMLTCVIIVRLQRLDRHPSVSQGISYRHAFHPVRGVSNMRLLRCSTPERIGPQPQQTASRHVRDRSSSAIHDLFTGMSAGLVLAPRRTCAPGRYWYFILRANLCVIEQVVKAPQSPCRGTMAYVHIHSLLARKPPLLGSLGNSGVMR